ncbi:DUF4838 domain-containing protein [Ramlibacter terrae]|uniref:DUF4838 domain-containing protein n=1 Tax=Ramlibacter terrae TaxID=2732511 RepID=A0ABX6P6S6_9BURK|nr:DUF4838 domain-containing protein [Ramlibacter terrae]
MGFSVPARVPPVLSRPTLGGRAAPSGPLRQHRGRRDAQLPLAPHLVRAWCRDYAAAPYQEWTARNRTAGGVDLQTGHAYGEIILALQAEFERHPEYYPLIDGRRKPGKEAKLCIGNEELRRLVVAYRVEKLRKRPALASVSVDPSDGGGWCECEKCRALGSISDRVAILANEVAAAVGAESPGKLVGLYAYNHHSPAPSVRIAPNVVVSVATAFLHGDQTVEEIMDGWGRQGAVLGVREYYAVNTWDRDQPAQSRGANLAYLSRTIPGFHARGARFMSAESSDNWGPNGLGYYIASRLLWDVRQAQRVPELVDDFLARAFGPARSRCGSSTRSSMGPVRTSVSTTGRPHVPRAGPGEGACRPCRRRAGAPG